MYVLAQDGEVSRNSTSVSFRQCQIGTFQNGAETTCESCEPGRFSDDKGSLVCKLCPPGREVFLVLAVTMVLLYKGCVYTHT